MERKNKKVKSRGNGERNNLLFRNFTQMGCSIHRFRWKKKNYYTKEK